ncbi:phosphoenolpyruvate carboxykinase (ATP), partial [Sulfuricurvum sp.]|uniref:phosphoenolpyruvate carboxykinase (ATP) n=1 Tax=Sulfuricurvum sp. TaxID=2025608 RepID=UPI003BB49320
MSWLTAEELGLTHIDAIHRNIDYDSLIKYALANEGAKLSHSGAVMVDTGIFTGRSPKDKYFVDQFPSNEYIAWGEVNKPLSKRVWDDLLGTVKEHLNGKKLFVNDVFAGASESSRRSIRFISEIAWQSHFVKNMFIESAFEDLIGFAPDFTFYSASRITNHKWKEHGLNSDVFIVFNIEEKIAIIGGTWYTGELKKGVFTLMNYWLPLENKLSMHC